MKGPYHRLKHDLHRVFECPECHHRRRVPGSITSLLCECRGEREEPVVMKMLEDDIRHSGIAAPQYISKRRPATQSDSAPRAKRRSKSSDTKRRANSDKMPSEEKQSHAPKESTTAKAPATSDKRSADVSADAPAAHQGNDGPATTDASAKARKQPQAAAVQDSTDSTADQNATTRAETRGEEQPAPADLRSDHGVSHEKKPAGEKPAGEKPKVGATADANSEPAAEQVATDGGTVANEPTGDGPGEKTSGETSESGGGKRRRRRGGRRRGKRKNNKGNGGNS